MSEIRFVMTNGRSKTYWHTLEDAARNLSETVAKAFKAGQDIAEWHIEPKPVELPREQRIEQAASAVISFWDFYYKSDDVAMIAKMDALCDALAAPAPPAAPSEPTEEEMRRVVDAAGWAKIYDDRNQGGRWFERRNGAAGEGVTLQAAYGKAECGPDVGKDQVG